MPADQFSLLEVDNRVAVLRIPFQAELLFNLVDGLLKVFCADVSAFRRISAPFAWCSILAKQLFTYESSKRSIACKRIKPRPFFISEAQRERRRVLRLIRFRRS